ncbi:MAG: hypothetical protein Q7U04_11570 [Bacteriovorax sp.]|nr:hypothetical protein [Bacteriovorax sp.]
MKVLILITISIVSLNLFAAELGEDKKSPCPFLDQSSKREAKVTSDTSKEVIKQGSQVISK